MFLNVKCLNVRYLFFLNVLLVYCSVYFACLFVFTFSSGNVLLYSLFFVYGFTCVTCFFFFVTSDSLTKIVGGICKRWVRSPRNRYCSAC